MRLSRRGFIASTATLPLLSAPALAQAKPVRVGYIADYFGTSLTAIASDQKLWEQAGLTPDLKVFTNGPIQVQALGAGSLDFGYVGPGALWLPASGKAKIVAINAIGFSDRVIGQAHVKTIADLKGKKIGVPEGTSGDMMLRLALAKGGLQMSDIEAVKMDPSTVVSAFASKQIDAAGIWYPLVSVLKQRVPDLNEIVKSADFFPKISFPSAFVARNEVVEADADLVKRMISVLKKANDYRLADIPRSVAITTKFLNSPLDAMKTEAENGKFLSSAELSAFGKDGTVQGWLKGMNEMFATFGRLQNPLDPKDYYLADLYASS